MAEAEPVIRAALPDANVPTSIRSTGIPVVHGSTSDLDSILDSWLAANPDGIACVIGSPTFAGDAARPVADPGARRRASSSTWSSSSTRSPSARASRGRSTGTSR